MYCPPGPADSERRTAIKGGEGGEGGGEGLTEKTCKPKVTQLHYSALGEQNVFWLHITMDALQANEYNSSDSSELQRSSRYADGSSSPHTKSAKLSSSHWSPPSWQSNRQTSMNRHAPKCKVEQFLTDSPTWMCLKLIKHCVLAELKHKVELSLTAEHLQQVHKVAVSQLLK